MNSVQLTGNLTQDPQLRKTSSDTSVAQMRLACAHDEAALDGHVGGVHLQDILFIER